MTCAGTGKVFSKEVAACDSRDSCNAIADGSVTCSSMSLCDDNDVKIVKVRGRGIGTNKMEALKDAYRDAVEQAVGLYVDAEQMVKNEDLVKDQILTHSNAFIEKYKIEKEDRSEDGLITVTILADVRKLVPRKTIVGTMSEQKATLSEISKDIHAQIVTDTKRKVDFSTRKTRTFSINRRL